MRTDQLRELLERYPQLGRSDRRRLRALCREASATDVMTIMSSPELGPKLRQLDPVAAGASDRTVVVVAVLAALLVALYILFRAGVP
jgi:hypothetical protein